MELKIYEVKNFSGGSDVLALPLILNVAYLLHLNLHLKCRFRSVDFDILHFYNLFLKVLTAFSTAHCQDSRPLPHFSVSLHQHPTSTTKILLVTYCCVISHPDENSKRLLSHMLSEGQKLGA